MAPDDRPPVVDVHAHAFPDAVAARAIDNMDANPGVAAYSDGTIAGLVRAMDRSGVDISVVQPVATKPGQVASINDWAASVASDRIIAFGAMHPDLPDPAREIARMAAMGIRGMKLHPESQAFDPAEDRMRAIYRTASAHDLVVLFHAGHDPNFDTVAGAPATFRRVLDENPDLTVVLAHMGGWRLWGEVREHLVGARVYLDTAYTLGHLPDGEFVDIALTHGTERILFGSDSPWTDQGAEIRALRALGLPSDAVDDILGGNAARLLGVTVQR